MVGNNALSCFNLHNFWWPVRWGIIFHLHGWFLLLLPYLIFLHLLSPFLLNYWSFSLIYSRQASEVKHCWYFELENPWGWALSHDCRTSFYSQDANSKSSTPWVCQSRSTFPGTAKWPLGLKSPIYCPTELWLLSPTPIRILLCRLHTHDPSAPASQMLKLQLCLVALSIFIKMFLSDQ